LDPNLNLEAICRIKEASKWSIKKTCRNQKLDVSCLLFQKIKKQIRCIQVPCVPYVLSDRAAELGCWRDPPRYAQSPREQWYPIQRGFLLNSDIQSAWQRWDFLEQERSRGQTTFKPLQIAKEFNDTTRLTRLALL
jgi:hypothetical protein